ncbi:hypothetical protein FQN54_006962 [Arachnomyces sp. PD_36]|nr:hypothetical protein FQN54_006962 [Arachnomyces sp. PD_36]
MEDAPQAEADQGAMAPPGCYTGQSFDGKLITLISGNLDELNVPNVLWGDCLMNVYGVPLKPTDITFVVPDALISIAYVGIYCKKLLLPCPDYDECYKCRPCIYPRPEKHFHLPEPSYNPQEAPQTPRVEIATQSQVLWGMTSLRKNPSKPGDENFMFIPSPCLPAGELSDDINFQTVKIPTAARLTEALIRLFVRDKKKEEEARSRYWMNMLRHIHFYVKGTDVLPAEDLEPRFRSYFENLMSDSSNHNQTMEEFEKGLEIERSERGPEFMTAFGEFISSSEVDFDPILE